MSRYRKIDVRVWNDAKFRELSDNAKLVFFLLLTHPNMTSMGAMRGTLAGLAAEMGWDLKGFRNAFGEISKRGMAEHDERACLVALPNFVKYNMPESPNVIKAWVAAMDLLPECALKTQVILRGQEVVEGLSEPFRKAFREAFREAFAKGMANQEQEQEPKLEQEEQKDSLRSSSSAALTMDQLDVHSPGQNQPKPDALQRLAQVTDDATDAYNAICAKPYGLMPKATIAGRQVRQQHVKRVVDLARAICSEQNGSKRITPKFWADYFSALQADEFHSGRQGGGKGHDGWTPDFEYATQRKTMLRVYERAGDEA